VTGCVKLRQPGWPPRTHCLRERPRQASEDPRKETTAMNQQEQKRKRALIVFQIVIYGYLLVMFGVQLYMSFARGWWDL
jgi:cell division septal protein FtsQ